MERFVQKERALLSPSSPSRDPDIDFNDVFGGPPKRSTSHESRYSFSEPTRSNSRTQGNGDVDTFLPSNPWSGRSERPVFGEEMGSRRKYPSNDFYDDIFRGDETPVGSPRRASHEPFGPGSVLSPTRPLPPRPDSFGTSLPAQVQFSLPAKLTRGMDSPSYASGNSSKSKYKEPISNAKGFPYTPGSPLYKPSPLSHKISINSEVPSLAIKPEELKSPDAQTKVKNDSISTEKANEENQFHFSIYKWASKGVPMLVPLRGYKSSKLKEAIKTEILSSLSETELQDTKRNASTNNKVHHAEEIKQGKGSPKKNTNMKFQTGVIGALSNEKREKMQASPMDTQQDQTPELKSLRYFLGASEAEGMTKTNKKSEKKEYMMKKTTEFNANADVGKTVQRRDEKKYSSKREETIQVKESQLLDSKRMSNESIVRRKAKGNVDEFANIFNKEANLKPKIDTEKQNQSSERGSASIGKDYKETSAKVQQKLHKPANTPVTADKKLEKLKKQYSDLKTSVSNLEGNSSDKKDDQATNSESRPDNNTQDIEDDMDDLFNETFTVEEISIDQDQSVQTDDNYEDIKTSDARIRKWSRGKEGNIRSLLSTLQYVLWQGSGWKPVPLVDIIDASAVKRSYQRAMLCLHPDKLQQKGAADYQKYIAEKVFDILQEAWDQFNSLGLI